MNGSAGFREVHVGLVGNGYLITADPHSAEPKQFVARTLEEVCAVVKDIMAAPQQP